MAIKVRAGVKLPTDLAAILSGDVVNTFNGRGGTVVPLAGDYTAAQVGAVDVTGDTMTGTLVIEPSSTSEKGLNIEQPGYSGVIAGTVGDASFGNPALAYNQTYIVADRAEVTGVTPSVTYGHNVTMLTGGDSTGTKVAFNAYLAKTAASTNASAAARDHIALQCHAISTVSEAGTGIAAKGSCFGMGCGAQIQNDAEHYLVVSGAEFDVGISSPASANARLGLGIVGIGDTNAAVYDAALEIGAIDVAGAEWNHGILFGFIHGGKPISTTGTCIGTDGTAATVDAVIDFSPYTATSYFLRGPGDHFTVDGAGATVISTTGATGAHLSLVGAAEPKFLFSPSSGATKIGQVSQLGNSLFVGDVGVAYRVEIPVATGSIYTTQATAIPTGGTAGLGLTFSSTANFGIFFGADAPTLSAAKGSLYLRSNGSGVNDRMYVNTNGSTTWTAVVTVG